MSRVGARQETTSRGRRPKASRSSGARARAGDGRTARAGHDYPGWSDDERAVLRLCDALHARGTIDDALFAELARHFSHAQILELTMLAGLYHAVSFIVNVSGVEPEPWAAAMPRDASRAGTPLLSSDGIASMASMLLMSHHAFRRHLGQLARALRR